MIHPATVPLSAGFLDRRAPNAAPAYLAFFRGRALIEDAALVWVAPDPQGTQVYLGMHEERALFAQDLSHLVEPPGEPTDLWLLPATLSARDLALACQGQHLLRWHARTPLCATCGGVTQAQNWGRRRRCQSCGIDIYPRTDPAVIMLVQSPDRRRVLLCHTHRMPPGLQSLLAGYVEPGESLEDTVARETWEEAGLRVQCIRYTASQPWAPSGSLMCGFSCVAESETLRIDPEELERAAWYSRDDLTALKTDSEHFLPRRNTIARHMLELWWKT